MWWMGAKELPDHQMNLWKPFSLSPVLQSIIHCVSNIRNGYHDSEMRSFSEIIIFPKRSIIIKIHWSRIETKQQYTNFTIVFLWYTTIYTMTDDNYEVKGESDLIAWSWISSITVTFYSQAVRTHIKTFAPSVKYELWCSFLANYTHPIIDKHHHYYADFLKAVNN